MTPVPGELVIVRRSSGCDLWSVPDNRHFLLLIEAVGNAEREQSRRGRRRHFSFGFEF